MDLSSFYQGTTNLIHFKNPTNKSPSSLVSGGMQILKLLLHKLFRQGVAQMFLMPTPSMAFLDLFTIAPKVVHVHLCFVAPFFYQSLFVLCREYRDLVFNNNIFDVQKKKVFSICFALSL
jgi:hypothetical protein